MAINDAYATAAQYRAVIGKTDTASDSDILTDLKAISRYLEGKLGRFFTKDAADIARIYIVPDCLPHLWIDDLSAAPASIKIDLDGDGSFADEDALAAGDYELLPLNAALGPEPRPYTRIRLTEWGSYVQFAAGQRVQVLGKWGWPSVPDAVQRATIHLAAILRLETPRATKRINELEQTIEASAEAMNIVYKLIDNYWKPRYV